MQDGSLRGGGQPFRPLRRRGLPARLERFWHDFLLLVQPAVRFLPELRHQLGGRRPRCPTRGARDRKSTRLNSSHLGISYAVVCLKKKTKRTSEKTARTAGL